ncbi:MAG: hypothetical protein H2057_07860 [Alphaproteobacteria bacterium]|nr:hypothetical protein [Alphaproteobacteria bacterium]
MKGTYIAACCALLLGIGSSVYAEGTKPQGDGADGVKKEEVAGAAHAESANEMVSVAGQEVEKNGVYTLEVAKDMTSFYASRPLPEGLTKDADGRVMATKRVIENVKGVDIEKMVDDLGASGFEVTKVTKEHTPPTA